MGWDLRPLLAPRSIAIVGASESPDSWAPEIERSLRHIGYTGELYPINPKYDTVWGRPCLSSIARAAARRRPRGVRGAGARRGADDRRLRRARACAGSWSCPAGSQRRATRAVRCRPSCGPPRSRTKIPVLGPNVEGFVNYVDQVAPYGTTPPAEPVKGGISVISQSGTVAWTMNQIASDRAVGPADHPRRRQRGRARAGRSVRVGGAATRRPRSSRAISRRCATWTGSGEGWTRCWPRASPS